MSGSDFRSLPGTPPHRLPQLVEPAGPLRMRRRAAQNGPRAILLPVSNSSPARAPDSTLVPDRRLSGFVLPGEKRPRLQTLFPETSWGKAEFHAGDRIISWNAAPIDSLSQLRTLVSQLGIRDIRNPTLWTPGTRQPFTIGLLYFWRLPVDVSANCAIRDASFVRDRIAP